MFSPPPNPGQSLHNLATSAPPNSKCGFRGGGFLRKPNDLMIGKAVGGIIVFGGGLALYSPQGRSWEVSA